MSLKSFINYISKSQITLELIKKLYKQNELNIVGSSRYAKSLIIDAIVTTEKKNILLICPNTEIAFKWFGYFQSNNNNDILYYPPNENLTYEIRSKSKEVEYTQLNVISKLINKNNKRNYFIIITTEKALQPHLINKSFYEINELNLQKGLEIEIKDLVDKFTEYGYKKEDKTMIEGTWSRRGEIIDIYPVNNELPIRIEFYDNLIDKIREYDPYSQKTLDEVNNINIINSGSNNTIHEILARKGLIKEEIVSNSNNLDRFLGIVEDNPSSIINFINKEDILIFDEPLQCKEFANNHYKDNNINLNQNLDLMLEELKDNYNIVINDIDRFNLPFVDIDKLVENYNVINLFELESNANKNNRFCISDKIIKSPPKNINKLTSEINNFINKKDKVWILSAQPIRTNALLKEHECFSEIIKDSNNLDEFYKLTKYSTPMIIKNKNDYEIEGFYLPIWKVALITDKELYDQKSLSNNIFIRKRNRSINSSINLNKVKPGDYIVHKNHGIGKFLKLDKINIAGESRDYLVIQYQDGKISVAADQLNTVNRYRSTGKTHPKINKLGGTDWLKVKEKNKKLIKKIAFDLLNLYAEREKIKGHMFPPDGPWQSELEESFPHQATPDQIKAVSEIKIDMELDKPMDRLICGDVGFGKTEVAIRAIFKAITSGKQVILLVPTTILAQQHWNTISNRFSPYPINVSLLNRFKTTSEKLKILNGLKNNKIDLVVATHQILSKDIRINNLGLLVIDEEQRFGVKQKEKIKTLKNNIDVLTLSATPIPRTLYMSLSGVRQMSLLNTPPPSRRSIKTYLSEFDIDTIRTAISKELERGGQIFYVLPRIADIEQAVIKLKNLFNNLKYIIAHGQMNEIDLENAMITFNNGEVDLMICTTIIESGLDIPKVNTIIIEDAHKFGLSQLYQLRGRVGRSGIQAYAWMFYPDIKKLNESAKQRLRAIKDFSELGSGYQLAMKDMEIRGVGNILGEKQSGNINTIGYDLYIEMLNEAISEINGQEIPEVNDAQIDLPINAFIPATWISNREEKLEAYKAATDCSNSSDLIELSSDWSNRYGIIPKPVETLIKVMELKLLSRECGFYRIKLNKPNIVINTKMKDSAFKIIRSSLPSSIQNKFQYQKSENEATIVVRGLGVTDTQNQLDQLVHWFKIMVNEIKNIKNSK